MEGGIKRIFDSLKNKEENKKLIRWMFSVTKPYTKGILLIFLISIISMFISYAGTIIGKYVVDDATTGIINPRNMILMGSASVAAILIGIASRVLSDYINEKFAFSIRAKMFSDIQKSAWKHITKFHSGDLVTRLTSDIGSLSGGLISFVPQVILVSVQLIIAFAILFYYDKSMALVALVIGPIGTIFAVLFKEKYKKYQTQLRESESEYRTFLQENLSNITIIKAFRREEPNNETFDEMKRKRLEIILRSSRLGALISAALRLIYRIGYVVAFCWGAYRISKGFITYGTLTVFISLVGQVQGSIKSLAGIVPQVYNMLISAKRICDVTETEQENYDGDTVIPENIGVKISDLTFAYDKDEVLKDISLNVNPGEKIGIIGASGAGKTTLIRLLLALVNPTGGSIEYTGENGFCENACPASRRFISYVPQGNTLLSGTIEENLKTGKTDASYDEMMRALEFAGAAEFISKLPDGIGTVLSEKSGGISEGQAQRISIARALIADKPVLILDEATSALDEKTEALVLRNISENFRNRTCFIITHRKAMLDYCDRIIRIDDNGKIIELSKQEGE